MSEEIQNKTVTVSLKQLAIWLGGIVTSVSIILAAYYGLQAEIADLRYQLQMLRNELEVVKDLQDRGKR